MTARSAFAGRVLGIDPGSRVTGYGVIDVTAGRMAYVASGCIRARGGSVPERLAEIYDGVHSVLDDYAPDRVAIEQVFMAKNADSALKLGQARGVALAAAMHNRVPIDEYAARQIKQAVVGTGGASKAQVQHMVTVLLGLDAAPASDAGDALAIAICHVNTARQFRDMT